MTPQRIDEIARRLPAYVPSRERERAAGAAILTRVSAGATNRARLAGRLWPAFALVAILFAGWLARGPRASSSPATAEDVPVSEEGKRPVPARAAVAVSAGPTARYERALRPAQEVVRVTDGEVQFDVNAIAVDAALVVETADSDVTATAATFRVVAEKGRLLAVVVSRGRVVVRSGGLGPISVIAGDEWTASTDNRAPGVAPRLPGRSSDLETPEPRGQTLPARKPKQSRPTRKPPAQLPSANALPGERNFIDGWSLLQAGQPARAAGLLAAACREAGRRPLAEDACFWSAVALVRAGRAEPARAALQEFVAEWPSSSRVREAEEFLRKLGPNN